MKTLLLPTTGEVHCLPVDSIVRVEASSNYSKVYCRDETRPILAAKVLRWFEERLPQESFSRVHRTHLVNKNYMVSIRNNNIQLQSGIWIAVSKRKKKKVFNGFNSIQINLTTLHKKRNLSIPYLKYSDEDIIPTPPS